MTVPVLSSYPADKERSNPLTSLLGLLYRCTPRMTYRLNRLARGAVIGAFHTDVLHATQTAVQGGSGSFCAGEYSSLFSALSTPQGTLSSSSAHNGQIVKDGSESQVDDLLNKKRLLMSLGLGSYLEDNAIETAVVPPGLATTEIIAAPPVAVLSLPVVLLYKVLKPTPVLLTPTVLAYKLLEPTAVLKIL